MSLVHLNPHKKYRYYERKHILASRHQNLMRARFQNMALDIGRDAVFGDRVRIKPLWGQAIRLWKADLMVRHFAKRLEWFDKITR